ncbi:MAG: hypothetical protein HYR62_09995 [Actinobacteria bacterium]|nr:hypothetical protein [Actinomycetota bacterium]MBI3686420.1 hypothetical protein [Actinomycetota bacterium]
MTGQWDGSSVARVDGGVTSAPARLRVRALLAGWSWRYELSAIVLLTVLATRFGPARLLGVLAVLLLVVAAVPRLWQRLVTRWWCITTPRRVRACCVGSWPGRAWSRVPVALWTEPRGFGERMLLWCPAGTSAADLAALRGLLASACRAEAVDVAAHPRHDRVVVLDIIRRPLTE